MKIKRSTRFSTDGQHALNAICPYFTMFPLEFPMRILKRHPDARLVIDPFCGRGTTLYAARLNGIRAIGIDTSRIAVAISRAKLAETVPAKSLKLAAHLLSSIRNPEIPTGKFWSQAFHPKTLKDLCCLRTGLLCHPNSDAVVLLRAGVLGCLHGPKTSVQSYLSNQMQRTFAPKPDYAVRFWRKHNLRAKPVDVFTAVRRKLERIVPISETSDRRWRDVIRGDAADPSTYSHFRGRVDLVVTSPPYYGMRTYLADQWLRNWFLGGPPQVDYARKEGLDFSSLDGFAEALSRTWNLLARKRAKKMDLYIRFGIIPSRPVDPQFLLMESLRRSGQNWQIVSVRDAATAEAGNRQVTQMRSFAKAAKEFDLHAVLV
jgi:hypothetical protein